jgi:hypothetical protein
VTGLVELLTPSHIRPNAGQQRIAVRDGTLTVI